MSAANTRFYEVMLLVQVVDQVFLQTDGTTSDRRVYVQVPDHVMRCGYKLAGIQAITKTQNPTTNFRWNAEISYGCTGQEWYPATPNDLFSYVTADGEIIQTELTDTSKFRAPYLRINLACSNSTGSARESATVSLWLNLRFQT